MKTTRKSLVWLAILLLIGGITYRVFRPQPAEVEVAPLGRAPLRVTVNEEGKTRIRDRFTIASPIAGQLQRVSLKPGDAVECGKTVVAVVMPVSPELLDIRTRAQTEARVKAAEAAHSQAQANLDRAKANQKFAAEDLSRMHQLKTPGAVSKRDLDNAELRNQTASNELRAAEFASQVAAFDLEQTRAALDFASGAGDSDKGPRQLEIRAPVTGRVLRVLQESAIVVAPGLPIMEIGDPANLEIVIDVLSTDAVQIRPGAEVAIYRWGGPEALEARVRLIEPAAFLKVSALGVEEQRVNVIADFTSPPERRAPLGDAFRIEAAITTWQGENVLVIPTAALFRQQEHWACYVAEAGVAKFQRIEIGHASDHEAEVLSGLTDGQSVILSPSDRVENGAPLAVKAR